MTTKCVGTDALTGRTVAVSFGANIDRVEEVAAANGAYLAPGFVDLQVNGFAGVDFNSPRSPIEEIGRAIRTIFTTGTTRFYPTIITGAPDDMAAAMRNMVAAKEQLPEGAAIVGFHVEGPHISPEDGPRGAHPKRWVRRPDLHELHRMQDAAKGLIRLITISPEWPEATRFIEGAVDDGIVVSIGHTNATPEQINDAVAAGATLSTHLGNGAHAVLPRHPNYIWQQLAEDRLTACFIADGIHLPGSFLTVGLRAKGPERRILVTDAVVPAGAAPGFYRFGALDVEMKPGDRVVLAGSDKLAGSALRMIRGVENLIRLSGLSLADAVAMATVNPARAMKLEGHEAGLAAGQTGDLVEFNFNVERASLDITTVYLGGRVVYRA